MEGDNNGRLFLQCKCKKGPTNLQKTKKKFLWILAVENNVRKPGKRLDKSGGTEAINDFLIKRYAMGCPNRTSSIIQYQ